MKLTSLVFSLALTAIGAAALTSTVAFAKHGADDPAGHIRGGHGADDPAGDDRGGGRGRGGKGRGGQDDGPNHTMIFEQNLMLEMARHGRQGAR